MKNRLIIILIAMFISITVDAQNNFESFSSNDIGSTWQEFKTSNDILKTDKKSNNVVTLETNGTDVDKDYNKITWVFIDNKLMNSVIEFKDKQTVNSLSLKYGTSNKTEGGYIWYSIDKKVLIIFYDTRPTEAMVLYMRSTKNGNLWGLKK